MKKALFGLIVVAAIAVGSYDRLSTPHPRRSAIETAFATRTSSVEVEGRGTVTSMLRDDNRGSRHQRFVVRLDSGHTLLIAHNIDLASRVDDLRVGDAIAFKGEYEWNGKGGVIHWTHRDPARRHEDGWLRHEGKTYQ